MTFLSARGDGRPALPLLSTIDIICFARGSVRHTVVDFYGVRDKIEVSVS